jgi:hypothetical protein
MNLNGSAGAMVVAVGAAAGVLARGFETPDRPGGQFGLSAIVEGYLLGGAGRYRPGDGGVGFELGPNEP